MRLYLIDLLKALHYCHDVVKVIHKDIKPDNIMIGFDKEAVLIDFGMASVFKGSSSRLLNLKVGTYLYFAPEMFEIDDKSDVFGPTTDIWALGISIYEMLTG